MNVEQALRDWLSDASGKTNSHTYGNYQSHGGKFAGYLVNKCDVEAISDATRGDLDNFFGHLLDKENFSPETLPIYLQGIRTWFDHLSDEGICDDITEGYDIYEEYGSRGVTQQTTRKARATKAKGGVVWAHPNEVTQMLEHVPETYEWRNKLVVRLLAETGLRRGELADVSLSDVDHDGRSITVLTLKREDSIARTVYYSARTQELMDYWVNRRRQDMGGADNSEYLFPTHQSGRMADRTVADIVVQSAKNAGIQSVMFRDAMDRPRHRLTPHSLRHGFAVSCVLSGVRDGFDFGSQIDLRTLSTLMGHKSTDTTVRYLKVRDEFFREQAESCAPRF
ncbi:tyrosine-type recombinase/integrase [Halomarina salina]|uniref:Tyrosine-type recombinase/integrase n=1 Tax=Halomarina salina TaxID=1872699 RepID=A0ABD5RQ22_9EURY|nr:site-specific integrase [Halomarina salina]